MALPTFAVANSPTGLPLKVAVSPASNPDTVPVPLTTTTRVPSYIRL